MTDVLYICGNEKTGSELKWSLRSLARFGKGVGRVCLAGYVPDWIDRTAVECLEVKDISRGNKHINILNAILAACDAGLVRGDFQYSSDDHFLLKSVRLDRMPFWVKPGRLLSVEEIERHKIRATMYEAGLSTTKTVLEKLGLRTDLFCVHRNTWMSTVDVPRVREILAAQDPYDAENYGVEPTCVFMAARMEREPKTELTSICDMKLYGYDEAFLDRATYFSTGDGMTDALWQFMEKTFAKKSKYEL